MGQLSRVDYLLRVIADELSAVDYPRWTTWHRSPYAHPTMHVSTNMPSSFCVCPVPPPLLPAKKHLFLSPRASLSLFPQLLTWEHEVPARARLCPRVPKNALLKKGTRHVNICDGSRTPQNIFSPTLFCRSSCFHATWASVVLLFRGLGEWKLGGNYGGKKHCRCI